VIKDLRAGDPVAVGPYKLLGRLGAGGMGQVYLAKSPGGRLVAIKLIRPELAEERGFRTRFAGEIAAARNVSGIYTAAVVDADADAELPWMATVYVPGPSLTDAVEDNGPLPVQSVLALAAGLAEALEAIHRAGLVHRDMKPSNVLLAADGPRVIDFGISRALERSMMTTTGMVLGSPGFMSPEQAKGEQAGQPADVFSLGAILAYAATAAGPFGTGPTPALLYRVVREEPDLTGVPDRLRPIIQQCLAKDPAERPTPVALLESLSGDVGVLAGEWLPPAIADGMSRYDPTRSTPLPPSLREPDSGEAEPAAAADEPGSRAAVAGAAGLAAAGALAAGAEPPGPVPGTPVPAAAGSARAVRATPPPGTELAAGTPLPGAPVSGVPVPGAPASGAETAATRAEYNLPETSLVSATGGSGGYGFPLSGAGPAVPPGPPSRRRSRRWPLAAAAAAAIVIIAVAAVLALGRSSGGSPGKGPAPGASLAGDRTPGSPGSSSPTASAGKSSGQPTARATGTGTRQASAPAATAGRTASPTTSSSATWKPTSTSTATATSSPTWTPTSTATATSSPTSTPTTSPTTQAPTTNPTTALASPAAT
jgi:hypothetical protein